MKKTKEKKIYHCTGCVGPSWDLPEGRTHQEGTIEHPKFNPMPKEKTKEKKIKTKLLKRLESWKHPKEWFIDGNDIIGHNVPMEGNMIASGYIGRAYEKIYAI